MLGAGALFEVFALVQNQPHEEVARSLAWTKKPDMSASPSSAPLANPSRASRY